MLGNHLLIKPAQCCSVLEAGAALSCFVSPPMDCQARNAGFSLVESMLVVVIFSLLSAISFPVILRSVRERELRSAVSELSGYLENAQSRASGSDQPCLLVVSGQGSDQQIAPSLLQPNSCSGLPVVRLLSGIWIPLALNPVSMTSMTIGPRATLASTITLRLSSVDVPGSEYCIQMLAPSSSVAIGVWINNTCNHQALKS